MPDHAKIKIIQSLGDVDAANWDACANPRHQEENPFLSHAFLSALEETNCATAETGWAPHHILLENKAGEIEACMPAYLKSHSYGEYNFDHAWADAYQRAGGRYYPKLLSAIPFSPVTSPKLRVRNVEKYNDHARQILKAGQSLVDQNRLSSFHINFITADEWEKFGDGEFYLQRQDQQFHWENQEFTHFDEFLDTLASRKRKAVRKERKTALENDLQIEWVTGDAIGEEHWEAFYQFYLDTADRKWGNPYLNRDFFLRIGALMPDKILLILVKREGSYIAGALNMIGEETLFGRYWGATEHHPCLHFEVCYYQAIDFAIANNLKKVEAGAQGQHKLARGYLPTPTYSLHYFADQGFRNVLARYLKDEIEAVDMDRELLTSMSPFKKDNS